MFSNDRVVELTFHYFYFYFLISRTTVKMILVILVYSVIFFSSIVIWGFSVIDIKYPSSSYFNPFFVDCWPVCIIAIGSVFINPETWPRAWLQIFSELYPNRTYGFSSPNGLWKVVATVPFFVISPVAIDTLIGFKAVPLVIQVWSCIGKFLTEGHKDSLG